MASYNKGDVLLLNPNESTDVELGIALEDGSEPIAVWGQDGTQFEVDGSEYFVADAKATATEFISQLEDKIQGIATENLEKELAKKVADQIYNETIDLLASTANTVESAAEQAVRSVAEQHPQLLDVLTDPQLAEIAQFVADWILSP